MLKTVPYDYQKVGIRFLRDHDGRALLADAVGLGKSLQTIGYAVRHLPADPPGPVVCVVPAHLKTNWAREFQRHAGLRVTVLAHERVPPETPPPADPNGVLVINPDVLTPPLWAKKQPPPPDAWISYLAALRPRLLVGDEAQIYTNPDAARTRAFRWLSRRSARTTLLSGTPLANKPGDLWPLLNILWPESFPSLFDFGSRYAYPTKERGEWVYKGARNLDELHRLLCAHGMLRRRKEDVLKDLPAIRYDAVPLDCDLTAYRRAEADAVAWAARESAAGAERISKASALGRLTVLLQETARAKADSVLRWIEDFLASGRKLLVGLMHYTMSDALQAALGDRCVLVDGRLNDRAKTAGFDRFNRDPRCEVLLGNYQAAGTGWSCTATSDVALAELPWRPSDVTQFIGRVHGVGRGAAGVGVNARFLLAAGTLEDRMCASLQRKENWAAQAIDGGPTGAEIGLEDMLLETLAGLGKSPADF